MEKIFWENDKGIIFNKYRAIERTEIAPGIMCYENVIPEETFKTVVVDLEEGMQSARIEWLAAQVKTGVGDAVESNVDTKNLVPLEINYQNSYGIGCSWHDSYQILKYGVGQKFTNHIDDHPDYHRRVSTLYYLNDNYSGGELNFPRFNLSFKPKANQMVIFPSTYVYNHSVSPVTEGERYAVVSWLR